MSNQYQAALENWLQFYRDFGIVPNFTKLRIPEKRKGTFSLIVVAEGVTPGWLFQVSKELFPCGKWTKENLDTEIISERSAHNGTYAVLMREEEDADEELKGLSAKDIAEQNIYTSTFEERLLFGVKFFFEHGFHPDRRTISKCAGSRCKGGEVPAVDSFLGKMYVNRYMPTFKDGLLRARMVIV